MTSRAIFCFTHAYVFDGYNGYCIIYKKYSHTFCIPRRANVNNTNHFQVITPMSGIKTSSDDLRYTTGMRTYIFATAIPCAMHFTYSNTNGIKMYEEDDPEVNGKHE